jgi:TatD DNase family protein
MIDTHAHIRKGEDIKNEGLDWVVLSASCLEDSKDNLELAKSNNKLLPAVGIHPQEKGKAEDIERLVDDSVVAIGECGLDFSGDFDRKYQEVMFCNQIELSIQFNKPLIIHSRKAMNETIEILQRYKNIRGVIHCYTGGIKRIKNVIGLGSEWFFGIDGNLTYEDGLVEVVKNIPKDRLVLETDSPYLTPVPLRGEINYPQNVKYVYQKVADIWDISFEETEKTIDSNAKKLFGLK